MKIGVFSFLSLVFLETWCFAMPSEHLLVKLTRHAVEMRNNGLPILLTDNSKNATFMKVIQETLTTLGSENYTQIHQDRAILNAFLKENVGLGCRDCDQTVHQVTQNLLFRRADPDLEWMSHVGIENPSYRATLTQYPEAVISHSRFTKIDFFKILQSGRLGLNQEEVAQKASPDQRLEPCSHLLRGWGPTCAHGTFVQISSSQATLDQKDGFRNSSGTPTLILKNDILKRWDFHVSNHWPGGRFITPTSDPDYYEAKKHSFGPGEMDRFIAFHDDPIHIPADGYKPNELVFYNPIPVSEIREIRVDPEDAELYRKIVNYFNLKIPVIEVSLTIDPPAIRSREAQERHDNTLQELDRLMSHSTTCSQLKALSPEGPHVQEVEEDLKPVFEMLLQNPEIRAHFESLEPQTQKENIKRLSMATQTQDPKYLDPNFSYTKMEYDRNKTRKFLVDNRDSQDDFLKDMVNSSLKRNFIITRLNEAGEPLFKEQWMQEEYPIIKPSWQWWNSVTALH